MEPFLGIQNDPAALPLLEESSTDIIYQQLNSAILYDLYLSIAHILLAVSFNVIVIISTWDFGDKVIFSER